MAINNAFSANPDITCQLTGTGTGLVLPSVTYVASGNTLVSAAIFASRFVAVTTATGNSTFNATNSILPTGALVTFAITNDASGARTITWGTGFRTNTTTVGVASKVQMVLFVSDGTSLQMVAQSPTGANT